MKKTLGGDRLGSGKKNTVDLHNYSRSTHDLGYTWRSTMSAGTLVPFMVEVAQPGDTFDIDLEVDIRTLPTVGPLFGSYKAQLDVFMCPVRLYQAQLHNNKLGIGLNMSRIKLPMLRLPAKKDLTNLDYDNLQINPSCILNYLGIRGVGINKNVDPFIPTRDFTGLPLLMYWDIYKNYYANKQEEIGAVIHGTPNLLITSVVSIVVNGTITIPVSPDQGNVTINPGDTIEINFSGTQPLPEQIFATFGSNSFPLTQFGNWLLVSPGLLQCVSLVPAIVNAWRYATQSELGVNVPEVVTFDLANIDAMRDEILRHTPDTIAFLVNNLNLPPYDLVLGETGTISNMLSTQEGLGLKTYQSDLFNNWLSTEWIDGPGGINEISAVDTSDGNFTMDALLLARKVYDMLNRIAVSGGSYDDWIDAVYMHDRYKRAESPMYMGGLIRELVFQEVVSNAGTENEPLGSLAGKGTMAGKKKGGSVTVRVDEPSYIIGIVSLTPRVDYSQGNQWHTHLETMDDFHKPALDEIGFQELITEQMAWWSTEHDGTGWITRSAGKQPAWINYMTNVPRCYGNFAMQNKEMFMTLNRRYEYDGVQIKDLTTYIDPRKYNFIFAETNLDAQNFWVQIGCDITARRKMSAKVMPNL